MTDKPKDKPKSETDSRTIPLHVLRKHSVEWLAKRCEKLQNRIIELEG